jgi:hypothetical protein
MSHILSKRKARPVVKIIYTLLGRINADGDHFSYLTSFHRKKYFAL